MHVLFVDQSGKIEKSNVDTVIAVSNDKKITVLIPSSVKRNLERSAHARGKVKFSFYAKNFCIALSFALQKVISRSSQIVIDIENPGHEEDIRFMLAERLKREHPWFSKKQITFARIGKDCDAHRLAISVFRGIEKANRTLSEVEMIRRG